MEVKKSKKANLQGKKLLFLEIGFIAALLVILLAFEWSTSEASESVLNIDNRQVEDIVEMVEIKLDEPPPVEAPKPVAVLLDEFLVVDDDVIIDVPIDIITDDSRPIEIKDYVPDTKKEEEEEVIPFAIVEDKPMFMGGNENEFSKWLGKNMKYPDSARDNGVSGKVVVRFTVSSTGAVTDVSIARGIDAALDKEAMRLVSMSPKWTPGKQRGKPVPVRYEFPVTFKLL